MWIENVFPASSCVKKRLIDLEVSLYSVLVAGVTMGLSDFFSVKKSFDFVVLA